MGPIYGALLYTTMSLIYFLTLWYTEGHYKKDTIKENNMEIMLNKKQVFLTKDFIECRKNFALKIRTNLTAQEKELMPTFNSAMQEKAELEEIISYEHFKNKMYPNYDNSDTITYKGFWYLLKWFEIVYYGEIK